MATITVTFTTVGPDGNPSPAGRLIVHPDGTHTLADGLAADALDVVIPDRDAPDHRLAFHNDPARWARLCPRAFRTAHFHPTIHVTED